MTQNHVDVLIVGAGPVGTALAIDLIRRGLAVRLVDKAAEAFRGSRAKGLQPRTLEVFDDLGVREDVFAQGSRYPKLGIHLGPLTIPKAMYPRRPHSPAVPYPDTLLIPQNRTDAALHAQLQRSGGRVEFDTELIELRQDDSAVTATLTGPVGTRTVTASYLVGADGASSTVRKQCGITFTGTTDDADRMLIVDAVTTGLRRDRWHVWPAPPGRFVGACPLPHSDLFQWMIKLRPGEEPPGDTAQINARIQAQTGSKRIRVRDIAWRSVFRPNIRLADRYRHGRVFLAGDAAHVHTPAGAQGLNTGVQDAYNLGWKLAQVHAGARDRLLDTYEDERRPIAAAVLGLSTEKYQGMANLHPSSIKRGKDESQLNLTYHGGPLAPPTTDRTTTLQVGDRAPDAELRDAELRDGERTDLRLHTLLRGPHFTAIAYGPRGAHALSALPWPNRGAGLRRVAIDTNADSSAEPSADAVLTDPGHTFREAYGVTTDVLILVRPDGYIAHIAVHDFLASTHAAVAVMTPRQTDEAPRIATSTPPAGQAHRP